MKDLFVIMILICCYDPRSFAIVCGTELYTSWITVIAFAATAHMSRLIKSALSA